MSIFDDPGHIGTQYLRRVVGCLLRVCDGTRQRELPEVQEVYSQCFYCLDAPEELPSGGMARTEYRYMPGHSIESTINREGA